MPAVRKVWHLLPQDDARASYLAKQTQVSGVVAQLLLNRDISKPEAAKLFLSNPMTALHPPEMLPGADAAADRILAAIQAKKRICVYGDYDVDGTTGTAILLRLFRILEANAEFYVPNRIEEGYGLNIAAIRTLAESGVEMLISVDCGISALEPVAEAKRLGLEVIVTDHHEMKATLPNADAIVHPRLPGHTYPHDGLSGAGVAFKLAWRIAQKASGSDRVAPQFREFLLDTLALAALGLVADVMPLLEENRAFVHHGLLRHKKQPLPGMKALIESAGLKDAVSIKAEDIGFKLGPRLNAAGRLECARLVVDLLTTSNPIHAREIAEYLEDLNKKRQSTERKITTEAKLAVEESGQADSPAILVASQDWHLGVVGIVASRLVEHFGKPALVVAIPDDELHPGSGSGRSVKGLPLHEALEHCSDLLVSHGGHAMAAGFKVPRENLDELRDRFQEYVATHFNGEPPKPKIVIDAEVPLFSLTLGLLRELDLLEPYGTENPRPKFLATNLKVEGTPRRLGDDQKHLSFRVKQNSTLIRAIAFGMGDRYDELLSKGGECSVVFCPKLNEWQGQRSVEMEVIDFQPTANPQMG
ncbi:MAG: single-stranded-DNA-specific exonuclease RecJ [Fimbriiglobus sp.]